MQIDIQIEEISPAQRRAQIHIAAKDVDACLQKLFRETARNVRIKGFRPGKVPVQALEQIPQYRNAIHDEARKELLEASIQKLLSDDSLDVLSIPNADHGDLLRGKDYSFTLELEIRPSVDLSSLKGMELTVEEIEISDADIEASLKEEQERASTLRDIEDRPLQEGDLAKVDYHYKKGSEERKRDGVQITIGRGLFPKALEDALIGRKIGEEFDVEIKPEEGEGESEHFKVKLLSAQERQLPPIDDELAKDNGHEDLDAMRQALREKLAKSENDRCIERAKARLLDQIAKQTNVPIPQNFLNSHVENKVREMMMQFRMFAQANQSFLDPSMFRDTLRPEATKEIRNSLILQQAIRDYAIEADEAEVDAELAELAASRSQSVAYLKSTYKEEDLRGVQNDVKARKALDTLFANVARKTERLSREDLAARVKQEREALAAEREAARDAANATSQEDNDEESEG